MKENSNLGSVLLKLRFLASKLESDVLEEWVKHESEGYPPDVKVPAYRKISASYNGNFLGPLGAQMPPIPTALIQKFAGSKWVNYEMRQGIAAIDNLLSTNNKNGSLQINVQI